MDFEKVFAGNTQSEQRKFIMKVLQYLRPHYSRVVVPCCGQFALVKCAIMAGYPRESIIASDISFFSSLLGYLYTGIPISRLPFKMLDEDLRAHYDSLMDDNLRVAFLMFIIKQRQLRPNVFYEKRYLDELVATSEQNVTLLASRLDAIRQTYAGITYRIEDLRASQSYNDPHTIILLNPPAFSKGYSRMFDLSGLIDYQVSVQEWSMSKEYDALYDSLKSMDSLAFLYRYKEASKIPPDALCFAKEYNPKRYDYWLCTKPQALQGFNYRNMVKMRPLHKTRPIHKARVFSDSDEITPTSKITFVKTTEEHALYYRDLFAHKLGDVKAEMYLLTLIDGKIFAVTGYALRKVFTMKEEYAGEVFGFNAPHSRYTNLNRLLMLLITCTEFNHVLSSFMMRKNRFYTMRGLKTTCLAKYRKVKINNGILKIYGKEKMPNDMYKIKYQTDWHDRTFSDCVRIYLEELNGTPKP